MKINKFKLLTIAKYLWFPIFLACRIVKSVAWWQTQPRFKNWDFNQYFKYDLILIGSWLTIYFSPWYISVGLIAFYFLILMALVFESKKDR